MGEREVSKEREGKNKRHSPCLFSSGLASSSQWAIPHPKHSLKYPPEHLEQLGVALLLHSGAEGPAVGALALGDAHEELLDDLQMRQRNRQG